jgi:hypothetical protein
VKKYVKCLGIIALVAAIGLLSACGGEDPEKTIKVTGIPAEYLKASFSINVCHGNDRAAWGDGQLSGSTVTFDLYIDDGKTIRFEEKGTWNLWLFINGKWVAYADNTDIKNAVTTIPFSKFTMW